MATATTNYSTNFSANESEKTDDISEFVRMGRTGRRNAIADVNTDPNINLSPNSLTDLMRNVNCGNNAEDKS